MKYVRKRFVVRFCLVVLVGLFAAAPAMADDAWLSKIALSELDRVAETGEFDELATKVHAAILGRLSTGKVKDLSTMTDLVYVLRACDFGKVAAGMEFKRTEAQAKLAARAGLFKDGKGLLKWLLANRSLSRVLFRGMEDAGEPEASLQTVAELKAVGDKTLLAYPELVTAFATSRSATYYHEQPAPASVVESFKYYTTRKMRYDLKTMPYELSRYLADTSLNVKERLWAYGKYNRYSNPAKAYFDLRYDTAHFEKGDPKKISKLAFTLPNLKKVGGVCIEQAYYSAEVCKALGIPAKIVTGRSGGGGYHAWMMCFVKKRGGRSASWDSSTGRYEEQKYFVGDVQNPANGKKLLDCELMLEGAAALLPLSRRESADTAAVLALLTAEVANDAKLADLTELQAMAALYKKRFQKAPPGADKLKATIKIDMKMVEEFLSSALSYNIAHRPVWDAIIELRTSRDMLSVSQLSKFFDVLTSKTAKIYPDYSCEMVLRITPSLPKLTERMKVYKKAMSVYGARRDLKGRIMIACGDDYAAQEKPASAMKFYETAALRNIDLANIVIAAAGKAEKLLTDAGHAKAAIALYAKLFKAAKRPRKASSRFAGQTSYYILGDRLATMLEASGQVKDAQKIKRMIKR